MILEDLMSIIEETQTVIVTDWNNDEIARYDGKDSIPERYNHMKVNEIIAINNTLRVVLDLIHVW